MDYSAVGETTHLAARMEQLARPGTVLMTPATLHLAEGFVSVSSLGPVPVRGRREPLEVYELSGVGPALSRLQAAAQHGLTRFVGRHAEIDVLRRLLEQAGAGHGQLVAIVGEAGVGKSRLTWEFTRSHHAHGWLVLRSRSVSYAMGRPYVHVIDLLKAYLDIQEGDDARRVRQRVTNKLLTLDRALEPFVTSRRWCIRSWRGNPCRRARPLSRDERAAEWQIPATIQAILAARIDRLPPEDKALLQAASVIGRDLPFALLKSIADIHEESLRRGLTRQRMDVPRSTHEDIAHIYEAVAHPSRT